MEGVLNRVRVEEFSGQITLTANNSPIPLTVVNDLPITVRLVLDVSRVPGVEIDEFGGDLLSIPPNSKRHWLTTTVHREVQHRRHRTKRAPSSAPAPAAGPVERHG